MPTIDKRSPTAVDAPVSYRVQRAVQVSGLSKSTLYELMAQGRLRYTQVGRIRLIPADALHDLVTGE